MNTFFSSRLKLLRETHNYSQSELAELLGASRVSISYYENNSRVPDIDMLLKICNLFSVTSDYMLGLTGDPKPKITAADELGLTAPAIAILNAWNNDTDTSFLCKRLSDLLRENEFVNILAAIHISIEYNASKDGEHLYSHKTFNDDSITDDIRQYMDTHGVGMFPLYLAGLHINSFAAHCFGILLDDIRPASDMWRPLERTPRSGASIFLDIERLSNKAMELTSEDS